MPPPKKHTELYVGLFILTGLVLLGGLVLQFGKFRERLSGHYELTVVFDDASGVINGSEVRMGGARIGKVASLPELNEAVRVEVILRIKESIQIPKGSTFQIASATLLGDKLIVIVPPEDRNGTSIAPGTRLEGAGLSGLDALQNNAETVSRDVLRMLKDAEATLTKVDTAVEDIRGASANLEEAMSKVNNSLLAAENLARFDRTLENLEVTTGQWKTSSAKLEPTLEEARDAIAAIKKAAAGADQTLASADRAIQDVKPSLDRIPRAVDQFSNAAEKTSKALDRMDRGEGLLGALATDTDVALDAKAFMRNLRQHGIFRYKDSVGKTTAKPEEKSAPRFGGRNR